MKKQNAFHGSDLERVEATYGISKDQIINFAANVNPFGLSPFLKKELATRVDVITRYPDRDYKALRTSIGNYCHTNPDHIVVGNGSTELIAMMAQFIKPKSALILGPTYSEYEREIGLNGGNVDYYELKESDNFCLQLNDFKEALRTHYDLIVICNPNNPTSGAISTAEMDEIFTEAKKQNSFVMVDETYVEFAPDMEQITCVPLTVKHDNFICLRGVSKFYAAPGLRLGYAVTGNKDLLETIHRKQNPWSVNSFAEAAGILMYQDTDFQNATKEFMHAEQTRCYDTFAKSHKFKPYKANANFILLKILDKELTSADVFEACIKKGLMIRDCSSFPFLGDRFVRFCFMKAEDNTRLMETLLHL
ncbi:threonine-phosphate decarboxylase [Lachnospiraceae bacterium XBB1006]|nr:threonine-phosphate decarboxylase [Lachnospiraceae bacterium XBB1006]